MADFLVRWLHEVAQPNTAPRTFEGYDHIVRQHLIPGLGAVTLSDLTPDHIAAYLADRREHGRRDRKAGGLAPKTLRHHYVTLHGALDTAVERGILKRNPADAVDSPKLTQTREMQTLDEEGVRCFLDAARETPYYALFYLALFTGARRSELLALRWQDVSLELGELSISRGLHHLRDGSTVYRAPKSAKSKRNIALPPSAVLMLREHWEKEAAQRIATETAPLNSSDLVFAHHDGTPLLPDTITHVWRKLANRSGFAGIRFHDARHTHATLMLKAGIHPKIVQERLGHGSISLTLDTYSHVSANIQKAAAARFDEGLVPRSIASGRTLDRVGASLG